MSDVDSAQKVYKTYLMVDNFIEILMENEKSGANEYTFVQFTTPSGLHSVLERPFSEANGRPFLVKRSPLIVC